MISVIGLDERPLSQRAVEALRGAVLVVGGRRHLDALAELAPPGVRAIALHGDLTPALEALATRAGPAVVLASGDPGFFGIVRVLAERFTPDALCVLPAVSSVGAAFARVGLSWDDAIVASAHGRSPSAAVNLCRRFGKVAVFTSPAFGPAQLATALAGLARTLVVCERLGSPDERITAGSPEATAAATFADPNVVLSLDEARGRPRKGCQWPPRPAARWALPEAAFEHRDGMITKAEVRALALAWLGPGPGDLIWDVGAGSGAVAVEAARLGAAVIAVDADPAQGWRVRANAQRHAVPVQVVAGRAPDALAALPDPDGVFIGGGGALLGGIVDVAAQRARRAIVVALATLERVDPMRRRLLGAGLDVDGVQLSAARLVPLGTGTRLAAANPVFLLHGRRGEGECSEPAGGERQGEGECSEPAGGERQGEGERSEPAGGDRRGEGERSEPVGGDRRGEGECSEPAGGDRQGEGERSEPAGGDRQGEGERP